MVNNQSVVGAHFTTVSNEPGASLFLMTLPLGQSPFAPSPALDHISTPLSLRVTSRSNLSPVLCRSRIGNPPQPCHSSSSERRTSRPKVLLALPTSPSLLPPMLTNNLSGGTVPSLARLASILYPRPLAPLSPAASKWRARRATWLYVTTPTRRRRIAMYQSSHSMGFSYRDGMTLITMSLV